MKTQLKEQLDYVDATRKKRLEMADEILGNPQLLPHLLDLALTENNTTGSRAAWVLEFVVKKSPHLLYPHLDRFCEGLTGVRPDSAIRPLAKICEILLTAYYHSAGGKERPPLSKAQKAAMTEACFDWLIGPGKVAPKAYSMRSLLLLGREIAWVHPQLNGILQQQYAQGSPAYQARARQILSNLS
ncbi:MAG: adenylosuccinate lyase [Robiginitalea sp.]|nr:adenylosuccinate lyase [Robiginitalea sp.]